MAPDGSGIARSHDGGGAAAGSDTPARRRSGHRRRGGGRRDPDRPAGRLRRDAWLLRRVGSRAPGAACARRRRFPHPARRSLLAVRMEPPRPAALLRAGSGLPAVRVRRARAAARRRPAQRRVGRCHGLGGLAPGPRPGSRARRRAPARAPAGARGLVPDLPLESLRRGPAPARARARGVVGGLRRPCAVAGRGRARVLRRAGPRGGRVGGRDAARARGRGGRPRRVPGPRGPAPHDRARQHRCGRRRVAPAARRRHARRWESRRALVVLDGSAVDPRWGGRPPAVSSPPSCGCPHPGSAGPSTGSCSRVVR